MVLRLIGVLVAITALFVASTAVSQISEHAVTRYALAIANNAAPSIQHLSSARNELRAVYTDLDRYLEATSEPGRTRALLRLQRARDRFGASITGYLALPTFPGEDALWTGAARAVADLDQELDRILTLARQGDRAAAQAEFDREESALVEEASEAILRSISFEADRAQELALQIQTVRERSLYVSLALHTLSIGLVTLAGILLVRAFRKHAELQRSHEQLLEDRAEELEQFAGRVAHDILSPLGATALGLELARRQLPDGSRGAEALERGRRALERVKHIVDGLLEFARAGAHPTENGRADVRQVIEELVFDLREEARQRGIDLGFEVDGALWVACTPGILTSIVANLARNALKYIGDGPERRIRIRAAARDAWIRVEVSDTGPGIGPDLQERIFEPYLRGKTSGQPGIGLGLATVKRVVEGHRGTVGVTSTLGHGSVFWFELPSAPPPMEVTVPAPH